MSCLSVALSWTLRLWIPTCFWRIYTCRHLTTPLQNHVSISTTLKDSMHSTISIQLEIPKSQSSELHKAVGFRFAYWHSTISCPLVIVAPLLFSALLQSKSCQELWSLWVLNATPWVTNPNLPLIKCTEINCFFHYQGFLITQQMQSF